MRKHTHRLVPWLLILVVVLTVAACSNDSTPPPEVEGEPVLSAVEWQGNDSRLPREIARLALVDGETQLRDFMLDEAAGVAYVTDSDYRLHVVGLDPLAEIANFQVNGDLLTLDATNQRLYVAPYDAMENADPVVTIFDTANRQVLWNVIGERVAVDSARNRFYVGEQAPIEEISTGQESQVRKGVRLYDGETRSVLVQGEKGGVPLYNPVADEVIIVNYSAFTADPESLAVRNDLFPAISEQSVAGCTGCQIVRGAEVLAADGLVAFDVVTLGGGGGTGVETGALFFDASSMQQTTTAAQLATTCSSQPALSDSVQGTVLDHDTYVRYEVYNNLAVRDESGATQSFKDGMGAAFVNGATGAAYVPNGAAGTWVVDARTLEPLGVSMAMCPWQRASNGTIYAADGAQQSILVLAESGGSPLLPAAEPLFEGLAGNAVRQILLSPNFADDNTIYLVATRPAGGDQLVRSSDGGATWTVLGGLPMGQDLSLVAAISPNFANDRTLFVGGARSTYGGEGVWQSNDGGDTWTPNWTGLEHLRVNRLEVSPNYGADGSLLAYADFVRIDPWQKGVSVNRSDDGGITWTALITSETAMQLPDSANWLPVIHGEELPVRKLSFAEPIEVQGELGAWQVASGNLGVNETLRAIITAPNYPSDGAIYVVTDVAVRRTLDSGATWQRWLDPRVTDLTFDRLITAATATPLLADGDWLLLLATQDGNLWQEDPVAMNWGEPGSAPIVLEPDPTSESAIAGAAEQSAAQESPLPTVEEATPAPVATLSLPTPTVEGAMVEQTLPEPTVVPSATVAATAATGTTATTTATATPAPVAQATSATPAEPLPASAPEGLFVPSGLWAATWANDASLQQALGYALTEEPAAIPAAYQFFERGSMFWRSDDGQIYALLNNGTWSVHEDTFEEGDLERDPNIYTPGELLQPERGFGKLWRSDAALKESIGWGTAEEQGVSAQIQQFERGFAIRLQGLEYFVVDGGAWRTR